MPRLRGEPMCHDRRKVTLAISDILKSANETVFYLNSRLLETEILSLDEL